MYVFTYGGAVGHCLSKLSGWNHMTDFLRPLRSHLQSLCPCPSPTLDSPSPGTLLDLVQGSPSLVPGLRFDSFPMPSPCKDRATVCHCVSCVRRQRLPSFPLHPQHISSSEGYEYMPRKNSVSPYSSLPCQTTRVRLHHQLRSEYKRSQ